MVITLQKKDTRMIKIDMLNKIYVSKKRNKCHALRDVNLTLPSQGLVFVLGKSGSGKSTLLNLIGGLDNITSGKIEVDGNDLSKFNEKDFCNYRNTHIGFIFQDYHLIDELTVYENIMLSLDLRRIEDGDKIKKALEKVDLAGYENRYPTELSGGEQQRVAIARAIVKNPRIILADEPTGNLDTNTANAIIGLLKSLSSQCLILVVSHNLNDAYGYADRIVELKKGKIIDDWSKNPDFCDEVVYKDGQLEYPYDKTLSDKDIQLINSKKDAKIVKRTDKFVATPNIVDDKRKVEIERKNLSFGKELNISAKFLKNKTFAIVFSSFIISVIMIIMALAQTIISFNAGEIVVQEMQKSDQTSFLINKKVDPKIQAGFDYTYHVEIDDNDIQAFYDSGYTGKIYPVINVTIPVNTVRNILGISSMNFGKDLLMKEAFGTLIVDEDFLESRFGEIDYLAELEDIKSGMIITDFLADSILANNSKYYGRSYTDLLGNYTPSGWSSGYFKISAVINTNYRTKHKNLFEKVLTGELEESDFYTDEDYISFSNDLYHSLGYTYSLDRDFYQNAYLTRCVYSSSKLVINDQIVFIDHSSPYFGVYDESKINFGQKSCTMNYSDYNKIFGTNFSYNSTSFVPHKIKITSYRYYDVDNENPLYTIELNIDGLHASNDTLMLKKGAYPEIEEIIGKGDTYYNGLYFDGLDNVSGVLSLADTLNYEYQSYAIEGIRTMTKAVEVFIPIFEIIAIFLCVGVVFVLMSFASKMIGDKMHEIGIMKALGAKNSTIGVVFGLQIALIAILTCVLATIGYFVLIDLANVVLVESLKQLAPNRIVLDLNFLSFKPNIAAINCILTITLSIISLVAPMIKIKNIKPVKIIKAKD